MARLGYPRVSGPSPRRGKSGPAKEFFMKADIHPKYDFVVFKDGLNGIMFLTKSTMTSKDKVKYTDGKEYPLITLEISSSSHPFFTGQQQLVDTAGRVERFNKKYNIKK
jgi:large subunit ribosomal protein L31